MQVPNLYVAYLKERESAEVVETNHGFAIYKLFDDAIYLQDIYVSPEHRKSHVGKHLLQVVEEIGKKANKSTILGTTDISASNPEQSMLAILHSGFKVKAIDGNVIWFSKPLK